MPHISPSALDTFSCRLQWHWYHLGYVPVRLNFDLELGLGVHLALEEFYARKKDPVKVFTQWADARLKEIGTKWEDDIQAMAETRTLGIAMLEGYVKRWKNEPLKVLTTEHECTRALLTPKGEPTGCDVLVRVDAIVEDTKLHKLFVLEHKTFTQFTPAQVNRDHQFVAEVYVANKLAKELTGRTLSGLIYNGLRKQCPGPRVKNELFERHYVYINTHQVRMFLKRAYWTWQQMADPELPIYPQPNVMRCNYCGYKEACEQYMCGGDYKFILEQTFEMRKEEDKHGH